MALDFDQEIKKLMGMLEKQLQEVHQETDQCGFDRESSMSEDCYVCTCGWMEKEVK